MNSLNAVMRPLLNTLESFPAGRRKITVYPKEREWFCQLNSLNKELASVIESMESEKGSEGEERVESRDAGAEEMEEQESEVQVSCTPEHGSGLRLEDEEEEIQWVPETPK